MDRTADALHALADHTHGGSTAPNVQTQVENDASDIDGYKTTLDGIKN